MKRVKRLLVVLLALCMVVVPMAAFGAGSQIDYTESNGNYTYSVNVTAEFLQGKGAAFTPSGQYLLLIVKDTENDENLPSFTADDIMYIDQTASDNSGVSFSGVGSTEGFIPREYSPATGEFYNKVFITGTGISSPIYLGYLQGVPGVTVSGEVAVNYKDKNDWGTGNVTVTLKDSNGSAVGSPVSAAITSGSASYSFPTVQAGSYTVVIEKDHFVPIEAAITVGSSAVEVSGDANTNLYMWGDINGDGKFTVVDVTMARQQYKKAVSLSAPQLERMDMNGTGAIEVLDITVLRQYYKGAINSIPIQK